MITRDKLEQRIAALEMASRDSTTATVAVENFIAPCYLPLHEDIKAGRHRFYNLPGGRGSCKSSFVSLEIVDGIQSDPTGKSNAIVFRNVAGTMRDSVFSQIAWAVDMLGASHLWKATVSPMMYEYRPTGAQILFRGLDDASKLKSIKPRHGLFRYVWFEEFSELNGPNFARNVLQSVMRGQGSNPQVFRSFNPPISKSNWANQVVAEPDPRGITLHTTDKDIPAEWLGEAFLLEAERLEAVHEQAYRHEYLGEATGPGAEVFPSLEVREITAEEVANMQYFFSGVDFGFAADPACFTSNISGLQFQDHSDIYCDAAEPKSIADLRDHGLKHARACHKEPGCVAYRIKWLQHRCIVVDPARTPNAARELANYEYEKDKDGNMLSSLPDRDNHSIDSLAYALDREIYRRRGQSA